MECLLYYLSLPGAERNESLLSLLKKNHLALLERARWHRVWDRIAQLLDVLGVTSELWAEANTWRQTISGELADIVLHFEQASVRFMLIKGPTVESRYEHGCPRQSHDLDFVLATEEDYWRAFQVLRRLGYESDYYPMICRRRGRLWGVHRMYRVMGSRQCRVEMNFGAFPISPLTWMDGLELLERAQTQTINNHPVPVPTPEDALCILIGEAGSNPYYRVRDVVDFHVLSSVPGLDWQYVHNQVKRYSLNYDLDKLKRLHDEFERRAGTYPESWLRAVNTRPFAHAIRRYVRHIYPCLRNEGYSRKSALGCGAFLAWRSLCEHLVDEDKLLRFVKWVERFTPTEWQLQQGFVVHLVNLESGCPGRTEWKSHATLLLIRTPIGCFLASSYCLHEESELETAAQLAYDMWGENNEYDQSVSD